MSEGGRKVWNLQQFLELNEGAVCRAKMLAEGFSGTEVVTIEKGETFVDGDDETVAHVYYFGSDLSDYAQDIGEWPIDLIWEPNDDQ